MSLIYELQNHTVEIPRVLIIVHQKMSKVSEGDFKGSTYYMYICVTNLVCLNS